MYVPPKFAMTEEQTRAALERGGFAHLVTTTDNGMMVTALPMLYDADRHSLIGHVARANPHWQRAGAPSVALFTGPQAYITPTWYATKRETGKVVPTWNYDLLVVHGSVMAHHDTAWLREVVERLTERHERGRPEPWQVSDAPQAFLEGQLGGIVGVELNITGVEGKAKMSQNQPARNRDGVVAGLRESPTAGDQAVAERVADPGSTNANARG